MQMLGVRAWVVACVLLVSAGGFVAAVSWLRADESSWTFSIHHNDPTLPPTLAVPPAERAPVSVRQRALSVARRDDLLGRPSREGRAEFVSASEWWSIDRGQIGADLRFRLRRPLEVDAVLPIADIPPDSPTRGRCETPYRATWLREETSAITSLRVLVDLRREKVVDISTNAKSGRRSWVDGKPHPSCRAISG